MDVYEAIESRASVRDFTDEDVPSSTVKNFLETAVRAPTAGNLQPWRFYVVRDRDVKKGLCEAAWGQPCVEQAPVVIVVCAELEVCSSGYGSRGEGLYAIQDTAAAVENILLAIVAEELGACWVGAFNEEAASEVLILPEGIRPLAMVPIGHPAGKQRRTGREPFENYTKYL